MITYQEKYDESRRLLKDAMAILGNPEATAEDKDNAGKMHADSKVLMAEGEQLQEITGLSKKLADFAMTAPIVDQADPARPQGLRASATCSCRSTTPRSRRMQTSA